MSPEEEIHLGTRVQADYLRYRGFYNGTDVLRQTKMAVWLEHHGIQFREMWNGNKDGLKQNAILASQGRKSWEEVYGQIEGLLDDSKEQFEAWVKQQIH